jgi:hypothetical protein
VAKIAAFGTLLFYRAAFFETANSRSAHDLFTLSNVLSPVFSAPEAVFTLPLIERQNVD